MSGRRSLKFVTLSAFLWLALPAGGDPIPVHHVEGFIRGFVVLKDLSDKILASGDVTQLPAGDRVNTRLTLRFRDGSFYEESSVFTQRRIFRLLSYKQIQRGPAFKIPSILSFDTSTGKVSVEYTDKDGKPKLVTDQLSLPDDLANGILTTLLSDVDPKVETTLSMLVSTPKPRVVKLKISASGQDSYSIGGAGSKATHYVIKVDIGGVTGELAKVVGKQPPPMHVWVATGNAPIVLKSEGQLYEDGPIWRIEMASPVWPKNSEVR